MLTDPWRKVIRDVIESLKQFCSCMHNDSDAEIDVFTLYLKRAIIARWVIIFSSIALPFHPPN